jgi:hypothetical protein
MMQELKEDNNIYICSIDIGKNNFAFYIEEIDNETLLSIQNIPKENRYNVNGTPTQEFKTILKQVWTNGRTVLFKNNDLTKNCKKGAYLDTEVLYNMNDLLDEHSSYFDKCGTILIEKQMSFGKKHNTMALKIAQHCWSYFAFRYGRFKQIIEFPAYYKTQILGAHKLETRLKNGKIKYKSIDKSARKKWSVVQTIEILNDRKDSDTMSSLNSNKKKDDLADVITQLQAYKYLAFVDKVEF